ncbi:hypothetical protein [Herpetosiphon gulosus]|uniref:Uncharacterized protein n=1 Tax=Herpetosiphon gulosus TaxID=1973496 RepID=A0ABP9X9I6_9CHLR
MSTIEPSVIRELIISLYNDDNQPSVILHSLKNLGLGREMADHLYMALNLDPDAVTYVYAWYNGSIPDEKLNFLIRRTMKRLP